MRIHVLVVLCCGLLAACAPAQPSANDEASVAAAADT